MGQPLTLGGCGGAGLLLSPLQMGRPAGRVLARLPRLLLQHPLAQFVSSKHIPSLCLSRFNPEQDSASSPCKDTICVGLSTL